MRIPLLRGITLVILLIFPALHGNAQNAPDETAVAAIKSSPAFQSFIETYVSAINAKDKKKLKSCIYPKSLFNENDIEAVFDVPIPSTHDVVLKAIGPKDDTGFSGFSLPVRPTLQLDIKWATGNIDTLFLVLEGGKWYVDYPK